jgi:signal transduction histidine kinase
VVSTDPQTWKDYGWLLLLTVIGFAFGLAALVLWPIALSALSVPLWWWIPAHGSVLKIDDSDPHSWSVDSWPRALLVCGLGLVATVLTAWICAGLARGQAHLAKLLLSPGLDERVEELERTRAGAVAAQQDELERIERDLHDGAQARLVALALDLGMAEDRFDRDPEGARELVEKARGEARLAMTELRDLARGIRPALLTERGLGEALGALAARTPLPTTVDIDLDGRLPAPVELAAYFTVAEGLTNAVKHAEARSAKVHLWRDNGRLRIEVRDDGRGGADTDGHGLDGLRKRLAALDGTLAIASPQGGPTVLYAEVPCES